MRNPQVFLTPNSRTAQARIITEHHKGACPVTYAWDTDEVWRYCSCRTLRTTYMCGECAKPVKKDDDACPKCGNTFVRTVRV